MFNHGQGHHPGWCRQLNVGSLASLAVLALCRRVCAISVYDMPSFWADGKSRVHCFLRGQRVEHGSAADCHGKPPSWSFWSDYRNCVVSNACLHQGTMTLYGLREEMERSAGVAIPRSDGRTVRNDAGVNGGLHGDVGVDGHLNIGARDSALGVNGESGGITRVDGVRQESVGQVGSPLACNDWHGGRSYDVVLSTQSSAPRGRGVVWHEAPALHSSRVLPGHFGHDMLNTNLFVFNTFWELNLSQWLLPVAGRPQARRTTCYLSGSG
eukprot:6204071-Pleurochrysis_carterae.AAC.4